MEGFYYTYVLLSEKDCMKYTGYTDNIVRRIDDHNKGTVAQTFEIDLLRGVTVSNRCSAQGEIPENPLWQNVPGEQA